MDRLQRNEFIRTTYKTAQNETLEKALDTTRKSMETLKSFNNSQNKLIRFLALMNTLMIIFFIGPIILSGSTSKGFKWKYQKIIWTCVLILILLGITKKVII